MSIGCGGVCKKFIEDDEFVIYEYFSYNLNNIDFRNDEKIFDGFITIRKDFLIEPELKEKFAKIKNIKKSKRKNFKKVDVEKIIHTVYELIEDKKIEIENCSNAWKIDEYGIDFICYSICIKIFIDYQNEGFLPEKSGVHF